MIEQACADLVLDFCDRVAKLFCHGLPLQCINSVRMCRSGHDDERDDCGVGVRLLKAVVESYRCVSRRSRERLIRIRTCKRFYKHIDTLVSVLVAARCEHLIPVVSKPIAEEQISSTHI